MSVCLLLQISRKLCGSNNLVAIPKVLGLGP